MQASSVLLWKSNTIIETAEPVLKQYDTNPNVGLRLVIQGESFSLVGTSSVARMRFSITLQQALAVGATIARTNVDSKLRVNDILHINGEQIKVTLIDDISDPGFYRLKLVRGYNGTTQAQHKSGDAADVILFEKTAFVADTGDDSILYFAWSTGDTARAGQFEVEFEVTENNGKKFSIPETPLAITIVSDFNKS